MTTSVAPHGAAERPAPSPRPTGFAAWLRVDPPRPGHRAELQGLRAVAIGMVVVYHIFLGRVSGGVDVFLLISAFLLTGTFASRLEKGAPLRVGRYWIKAFKRLLPPAVVTILGVLLLVRLFFPGYRWREVIAQALASTFYVENWHLADAAVDYYAVDRTQASPLQHFWSLSIQGQVFLLWPLLFLLAAFLVRRYGWEVRRTLSVMFGTVFVASLAWSIFQTATHQSYAYFDTRARLWEFALGSLLALALPVLERRLGYGPSVGGPSDGARPWLPLRVLLGWAGLIGMLACGLLVQVEGAFPGWIALWPLGCACLVIGAGRTGTRWGVDHWLSTSILQRLGDMSYALYLVHWPLLVTLMVVQRRATPGLLEGFLLIAVSLRLAWFLTRYVDAPVRRSRSLNLLPGRAALVIAVSVAVGIAPPLAIQQALDQRTRSALAEAAYNNLGAAVLTGASEGPRDADALTIPLPEDVSYDWTLQPLPCRGGIAPHDADLAAACGQSATGEPGKLVMVVGDSRIQQFSAALQPLAAARGYTTAALLKGACPFTLTGVAPDCAEWNVRVLSHLLSLKPSAVYLSTTQVGAPGGERMMPGIDEVVHPLTSAGISVIGLRDQPRLPYAPIACVQDKSPEECTTRKHTLYGDYRMIDPIREAAAKPGSFHAIDLTPWVCPDDRCSPVIGNVFVYLDGNHLSQQYAATLAPMLDEQLTASGCQW